MLFQDAKTRQSQVGLGETKMDESPIGLNVSRDLAGRPSTQVDQINQR